jgi:hypothetical protein
MQQSLLACFRVKGFRSRAKAPASSVATRAVRLLVAGATCICACSEPLVAVVGVESDASTMRPDRDDAPADTDDAHADATGRDAAQDDDLDDEPETCLLLPDLVQAGVLGETSGTDAVTTVQNLNAGTKCPSQDDAGVGPSYAFKRQDGRPIVRAGRRYALRWPPKGKNVSLLALMGPLSGAPEPCERDERLATVNRTVNGEDCVELRPEQDAKFLLLETPVLVGLGLTEFELCPGKCSP